MAARAAVFISIHPDSLIQAQTGWVKATEMKSRNIQSEIYVIDATDDDFGDSLNAIMSAAAYRGCTIHGDCKPRGQYDIALFFGWRAARIAEVIPIRMKALVLDDIEAWQYPMGDTYVAAEAAIQSDLPAIALGRWVGRTIRRVFGIKAFICPLGTDVPALSKTAPLDRRKAICAVWDPKSPQTCFGHTQEALGIFNAQSPKVEIIFIGSERPSGIWYPCEYVPNAIPSARRRIFESCTVGLCLSTIARHTSALEMMASGLPVVNLFRDVNLYDYPDLGNYLAHQARESIAHALHIAFDRAETFDHLALAETMADRTRKNEADMFTDIVQRLIDGETPQDEISDPTRPTYEKGPIIAPCFINPRTAYRLAYIGGKVEDFGQLSERNHFLVGGFSSEQGNI